MHYKGSFGQAFRPSILRYVRTGLYFTFFQLCAISAGFVLFGTALHLLALAHNRAELNERQKLKELRDLATFTKILKNIL